MTRCNWCSDDPIYVNYHDHVWGRPVSDSQQLFAKLCLDGQQAGLSWLTILKRQDTYYQAYDDFDPKKIIDYDQNKIDALLQDKGIIRNKLKVQSIIKNAKGFIEIEKEFESFSYYLWSFVNFKPINNQWSRVEQIPITTPESDAMSKELKRRGFSFVGSTICYAFMQAVGMVQDHLTTCYCYETCSQAAAQYSLPYAHPAV